MDAVLGLSMTPTAVGLVLVEGHEADGPTMDREAFPVHASDRDNSVHTSKQAAAAVRRTQTLANARGHRLHSIGVTWTDDAETEASLLLESLTESGFDNVVPVRFPEATDALARGIADVTGYETTAVCVIEPETVIVLVVHTPEDAVQRAVNQALDSDDSLIEWLTAVFERTDWPPEALVLVGSAGDLGALMPRLEEALAMPVFAPAEAQLALARGAALASAQRVEFTFAAFDNHLDDDAVERRRWPLSHVGAVTVLVAAVLTFVVSGSVAVGLQLTSRETGPAEPQRAADTSATPAAVHPGPPTLTQLPLSVPAAAPPVAPPPAELPVSDVPLAPPPAEPLDPPVVSVPDIDVPAAEPPAELPAAEPVAPVLQEPIAPAPLLPPPPVQAPTPPPPVAQVPVERPGILRRIKDKLSGIGRDDEEQLAPAPVPPPAPVIPPPPLLPPP